MEHNFKVGDKVFITAKVEYAGERDCEWDNDGVMNSLLNDGVERAVTALRGYRVEVGAWVYLPECLTHVNGVKGKPKAKKKKPRKLPKLNIRKELRAQLKLSGVHGMANYAYQLGDNSIHYHIADACHARIVGGWGGPEKGSVITALTTDLQLIESFIKDKKTLACVNPYLNYLFNRSPWAHCFLTKKPYAARKYGVLMDVAQPCTDICGATTALREVYEFKDKLPVFSLLVKKGFDEHVAFLLSTRFFLVEGNIQYVPQSNGHQVLNVNFELEGLMSFFKNGYKKGGLPYSTEHSSFRVWKGICNQDVGVLFGQYVKANTLLTKQGQGWNAKEYVKKVDLLSLAAKLTELFNNVEKK